MVVVDFCVVVSGLSVVAMVVDVVAGFAVGVAGGTQCGGVVGIVGLDGASVELSRFTVVLFEVPPGVEEVGRITILSDRCPLKALRVSICSGASVTSLFLAVE